MILGTDSTDVVVGQVYHPKSCITDNECCPHPSQPLYIVREATFEEWSKEHGQVVDYWERYYEVLTD